MKYYSSWQEALMDYVRRYGHNYEDAYNLMADFELNLSQNIKGAHFIEWNNLKQGDEHERR